MISSVPVTPAFPPPQLVPAFVMRPLVHVQPQIKKVWFSTPVPATQLCRNPNQTVLGPPPLSSVLWPHLLGEVTVANTPTNPQPPYYRAVLQHLPRQESYQSKWRLIIPFPV